MSVKKVAILTSGGDSPGMNAGVRAFVKTALYHHIEAFGIRNGYDGLIQGDIQPMGYDEVANIIQQGGTILGSSRSEEFRTQAGRAKAYQQLESRGIDALVVIGGDGSFKGAEILATEFPALKVIVLPGTIDNDIAGTDYTIGYDTALNTIIDAVDKIRDTANSHHRVFFIEVMGRDTGFLALHSALAAGADDVLIPETHTNLEEVANTIKTQYKGKRSAIIIVAEGDDAGGSGDVVAKMKSLLPKHELRSTVLGHMQRGGKPSYFDRYLATALGAESVLQLLKGNNRIFIGYQDNKIVVHSIADIIDKKREISAEANTLLKHMYNQH
ncbi:6-phosphofructokinase [Lishizhenia tianjinensis]|uniref:ATP-dependent 6-phosphofructokinase n=1 Tax=Lishizhenia tianjinensis TaxID=477690 RepID=A0A1I7AD45_9FLAO|nr:6-phosphofructokinase [Lishizhenia tianjinensis]SFT72869.1 6-phosphofructokinase [Lishizhenia tianjinensis]